ncbi:hypothetical protein COUCH_25505 [Couchioplanes caeruleus]|uniref:hypothetical protein n=1 Tax=Couchioplanes caeruleus TaxID=56438 RepID=UPI0020C02B66|nr:hypothetical protein [Couchioplanes caeruleus]UQU62379.1 hypothetical protein COUCH_25505 [Couchioplanes caeruleus]
MTTDSVPAGDARRLLSDVRSLAHRVRRDQRLTWVALLVLAGVTFLGIPFDWFGMKVHCFGDGSCQFARRGVLYYWPPALLLAYAAIAYSYVRAARARGLGARVLSYAVTGAITTIVFTALWVAAALYLPGHPQGFPSWVMVFDRLFSPWGMIGIALLVLARLERNLPLLLFTVVYLAVMLTPLDGAFGSQTHWGTRGAFLPQQILAGTLLLLGGIGFARAARRQR